jgi:prepilin-type N-terminal cleavage/methylation domain-containing protein
MSTESRARQGGYSLAEVLVVIFIIGILSLVTIPAFMNYTHSSRLNTSLRSVTGTIRSARSLAVTKHEWVILTFDPSVKGVTVGGPFSLSEGTADPTAPNDVTKATWKQKGYAQRLETGVYFKNDVAGGNPIGDLYDGTTWGTADGKPDILFQPDGTISIAQGTFFLQTDYNNIQNNLYEIDLTTAVSIATKGSHV